jgi:PAS domain S-box-containing protein
MMVGAVALLAGLGLGWWLGWRLGRRGGRVVLDSILSEQASASAKLIKALEEGKLDLLRERIKIETIFAHLPDGLVITNLRGQVLFVNPPAMRIFGIASSELKSLGRGLLEPVDSDKLRMPVQEVLKNHTHSEVIELPAGVFRTTVTMFSAPGGGDFGVLLILRDVTGERRLSALKEEFFQAVAHDLRAPLFAMQGYLRLLEKAVKPEGVLKGYFDSIAQSCEKLTLLIQDTLDSARLETGQLTLSAAPVEPAALLQRVATLFSPIATEKGIKIELELASSAPKSIDADERLLERVFTNLISNALKFTPRGGRIGLEMSGAGADQVEFTVSDTGPGIAADQRTRVFEKFHQSDDGRRKGGFGLGLNICHKIVTLHRGTIWVESEPGLGSQFIFRIPTRSKMEVS